jgi:hypothetical protein
MQEVGMGVDSGNKSSDTMHLTGVGQDGSPDVERAAMGAVDVDAKVTLYVVLACMIAASGGILFGKAANRPSYLFINYSSQ